MAPEVIADVVFMAAAVSPPSACRARGEELRALYGATGQSSWRSDSDVWSCHSHDVAQGCQISGPLGKWSLRDWTAPRRWKWQRTVRTGTTRILNIFTAIVVCSILGHRGDWKYLLTSSWLQMRDCRRCGKKVKKIRHRQSDWRYLSSTSCEQIKDCRRCLWKRVERVHHSWGEWAGNRRKCRRCGELWVEMSTSHQNGAYTNLYQPITVSTTRRRVVCGGQRAVRINQLAESEKSAAYAVAESDP